MNLTSATKITRTKKAIRRSFLSLVKEKHVSGITVRELTELAEVNRSTFYAYYDSVEALDKEIETEMAEGIIAFLGKYPVSTGAERERVLSGFLKMILDKDENTVWLFSKNTYGLCEKQLLDYCKGRYYAIWREASGRTDAELDIYFKMAYNSAFSFFGEICSGKYKGDEKLLASMFNDYMEAIFILMFDRNFIREYKRSH